MSLSVNFNTHSKALSSTYQSVLNGDEETSWVIYGYDKGNNDLKVLEKGAGGLEDLVEEFIDGKIQYAFVRVIDPNTELPKFVLIGWCGEGVPEIKKGLFNSHFNEVSKFLKGYHLQINARSEDDVDPKYIMKRINESGGSKYSINVNKEKPRKEDPILPVHSVYEPVKIPDITALQRQAPREEFKPIGSVYQPVQLPKPKPLGTRSTWTTPAETSGSSPAELKALREERERKEREEKERERIERERIERERIERERIERERVERERVEREEKERERTEREEEEHLEAERLEAERQQELEEAARKEQAEREEQDRIKHERELQRQREIEEERSRKAKDDQERMEKVRKEKEEKEKREREEEEERQRLEFEREQEQEAERLRLEQEQQLAQTAEAPAESITAVVQFSYDASEDNEMSLIEGEVIKDIIQLDEGWWQGVSADGSRSGLFPANYVEIVENAVPEQPEDLQVEAEQQMVDSAQEQHKQHTAKAIATYDYSASEENEISFSEGDIITDIIQLDEGWWQGQAPDGTVGLFPANYVELQGS